MSESLESRATHFCEYRRISSGTNHPAKISIVAKEICSSRNPKSTSAQLKFIEGFFLHQYFYFLSVLNLKSLKCIVVSICFYKSYSLLSWKMSFVQRNKSIIYNPFKSLCPELLSKHCTHVTNTATCVAYWFTNSNNSEHIWVIRRWQSGKYNQYALSVAAGISAHTGMHRTSRFSRRISSSSHSLFRSSFSWNTR